MATKDSALGCISILNNLLVVLNHKLPYMKQWESDLNITLGLSEWQDIANNLSKISINTLNPTISGQCFARVVYGSH